MMNTTLTAKQQSAYDKLKRGEFVRVPARVIRARESRKLIDIPEHIETGLNSTVLGNLLEMGLIRCTTVYLRGHVTADLEVL